ncbi:break repair meiotic recombinase recruitment factor 1-like isoform X1 [Acipenser ruthenus]|uniref:break repair meiotic recombinase recruitment factor 1-like isoform X1 n=1 Tax=Acipenser ruthenus TaxID=7906 RepID=UPI002740AD17|nr:break repair meiotic recombinase recruitment factor 1-like isoform X1 [Acipenser ruthenus]
MSKRKRQQSAGGKRKGTTKKKKVTQEKASGTVNEESAACGQQAELRCEDDRAAPSSAEERGVAGSRSESEGGDGAHKLSPGVKDCFLPLAQNILPGRSSTAGLSCDDDEEDDDDVAQPSAPEDTTSDQHRGVGEGPGQGDATLHSHGGAQGPNHKASTSGEQRQEADPERQQPTVTEQGGAGEGVQELLPHPEGCGTPGLKASLGLEGTETQGGGVAGSPQGGLACLLGSAEAVFTEGGKQSKSAKPKHVETYPETQAETSADLQGKGVAEPCIEAGAQPAPPHSHCGTPGEPPALPAAAASAASVPEREESTRLCKGVIPRQGRGVAMEKGSQVFPNPGSGTTTLPRASAASWSPRSCAGRSRIRLGNEDAESAAGRKIQDSEEAGPEMNEKDFMRKTQQSHSQSRTETEELKASQSFGEGEGSDWGQIKLSENNKLSTSSSSAAAAAESKPAAVYVNPCVLEERDWESRFAVLEMEDSSDAGAGQRKAKGAARSRRCKPATSAAAAAAGKREVRTVLVCAETACPDLTHTEAEGSLQGAAGAGGQTDPASAAQDREEGGPHPITPAAARGSPESEREDTGATQSCEDHSEWDSEFLQSCSTQRFPDSCSLPAPLPVLGTESGGSALELPLSIGSISDSQLHEITLGEAMPEPRSQSLQDYEDASELVCGLIEELSQINRLIMLTHRELQSGRNPRRARLGWRGAARYTANPKDL